jgi:hypothetical protein
MKKNRNRIKRLKMKNYDDMLKEEKRRKKKEIKKRV